MITFLFKLMVALKAIFEPLELTFFRVIKLSILEFVRAKLLIFLTPLLKVMVIFESTAIVIAAFTGSKIKVGGVVEFAVVKFSDVSFVIPT